VPDTTYRLAKHIVAKIVGLSLALVGVLMVVLTLVAAFARFRPQVLVLVGLLGLVIVIGVAAYAGRGLTLVRFDDVGYRVRTRRGSGVRSARWADVKDAVTAVGEASPSPVYGARLLSGLRSQSLSRVQIPPPPPLPGSVVVPGVEDSIDSSFTRHFGSSFQAPGRVSSGCCGLSPSGAEPENPNGLRG
jgi:hypothetical protein